MSADWVVREPQWAASAVSQLNKKICPNVTEPEGSLPSLQQPDTSFCYEPYEYNKGPPVIFHFRFSIVLPSTPRSFRWCFLLHVCATYVHGTHPAHLVLPDFIARHNEFIRVAQNNEDPYYIPLRIH